MNWDALGALAETVGAIGVIATLTYLAIQVRQNTRALRSQTYESCVSQFRAWNEPMRADEQLAARFHTMVEDIESMTATEQRHATHVLYDFVRLAENLHYQFGQGMLEDSVWRGWESYFHSYLTAPGFVWYWEQRRSFFASEFNSWVDDLIADSGQAVPRVTAITVSGSEPAAL